MAGLTIGSRSTLLTFSCGSFGPLYTCSLSSNGGISSALKDVKKIYDVNEEPAPEYSYLRAVRHFGAFHYPEQKFRDAFDGLLAHGTWVGSVVGTERDAAGRFTFADQLVDVLVAQAIGEDITTYYERLPARLSAVMALAGALRRVVDRVVLQLFLEDHLAVVSQREGTVRKSLL